MDSFSKKAVGLSLLSPVILWLGFALTPGTEERAQSLDGLRLCADAVGEDPRTAVRSPSPAGRGCEAKTG